MIKNKPDDGKIYLDARSQRNMKNVCDLKYLTETMNEKKHLIKELIDIFLKQVPQDVSDLNDAVRKTDYPGIKTFSHSIKSSVSIMGIAVLAPILHKIGELATAARDIEMIKKLNDQLNLICKQAIEEIEKEKHNYI